MNAPSAFWKYSVLTIGISALLMAGRSSRAHSRGVYSTESEAQSRALQIGCTKVHQNNGKWMPCADERELHRQLRKQ